MRINGQWAVFPKARLKLEGDGTHLTALLFSDDPPEAIKDDYQGNSFYLPMALDIDEAKDLASATWSYRARTSEREDTPYGIYLNGRKMQLQPYDVRATFAGGDLATITLSGEFLLWQASEPRGPAQTVAVVAELPVKVETDSRGGR